MLLPVVVCGIPRLAASVDKFFFVLLCLPALASWCLLVHIVLGVSKDLAQPVDCMVLDLLAVLIKDLLPFFLLRIVDGFSPLPGC